MYKPQKGAKSITFSCELCDSKSHADWLFTEIIVLEREKTCLVLLPMPCQGSCLLRTRSF